MAKGAQWDSEHRLTPQYNRDFQTLDGSMIERIMIQGLPVLQLEERGDYDWNKQKNKKLFLIACI